MDEDAQRDLTSTEGDPSSLPVAGSPAAAPALPPVDWTPTVALDRPSDPPALDVGDVFWRIFRTYALAWRVFLILNLPAAAVSAATSGILVLTLLSGSIAPALASFALVVIVAVLSYVATIIAAADVRAGAQPTIRATFGRAGRRLLPAIGTFVAIGAVVTGAVFVISIIAVIVGNNPGGSSLFGFLILVGAVVVIAATIRWMLAPAAVALAGYGPIAALGESRRRTRRNAWRLFALLFVMGLATAPLSIGLRLVAQYADPIPTAIASFVAALVTGPLLAISTAIAYGDLTEQPVAEREGEARRPRQVVLGSIVGIGVAVLTVGVVVSSQGGARHLPVPDPGVILAGTGQNAFNRCRPDNIKSTFGPGEPIYIGGYFTRTAIADDPLTVAVYLDGTLVVRDVVADRPEGISCYYEPKAIEGAGPGEYRIQILNGVETVADGKFTVR